MADKLPSAVVSVEPVFDVGFLSGGNSFFNRVKGAKFDALAVRHYLSSPLISVCAPIHAAKSRFIAVSQSDVLQVLGSANRSKVYHPVVGPDAVDMVDVLSGPFAVSKRPQNAVGLVASASYVSTLIASVLVNAVKGAGASKSGVKGAAQRVRSKLPGAWKHTGGSGKPKHIPSFGIVAYNAPNIFNRGLNHIISLSAVSSDYNITPRASKE